MAAPSSSASTSPSKVLGVNDALSYIDKVKAEYEDTPTKYSTFLTIMKDFKENRSTTQVAIQRVTELFQDKPYLLQGFSIFLPEGYTKVSPDSESAIPLAEETTAFGPNAHANDPSTEKFESAPSSIQTPASSSYQPQLPPGYKFHPSPPPLADYLHLRRTCGLTPISPTQAAAAIKGGWYFVHISYSSEADDESSPKTAPKEQVIGMGRVVGDGAWYFDIADMAVLPEHQKKGLGGIILGSLLQKLKEDVEPGYIINLSADPPGRKLYAQWGFRDSAPASVGMMQWVGGKGEKKGEGHWPL